MYVTAPAEFLTTYQAADRIGVHYSTMRRWVTEGKGPKPTRHAGRWNYAVTEVERWIREGEPEG
jgi:predicted site-specific integrase-resolvase